MEELYRKMTEHGFGKEDFESDRFVRLRTLKIDSICSVETENQ